MEIERFDIQDDFFSLGLRLVIDGTDGAIVREALEALLAQERDPYRRLLKQIICEGVLGIQADWNPRLLLLKLTGMVNIPGNDLTPFTVEYDYEKIQALSWEFPAEREEAAFIKRAMYLAGKIRKEGAGSIEKEVDSGARDDVFELGLFLVIDNIEAPVIERILDGMCSRETDPWKKKLALAKKAAVLSLQAGDIPRQILTKVTPYFDDYVCGLVKFDRLEGQIIEDD